MERKGSKHFEGFRGFEPLKVCTLRERISHILSKNVMSCGRQPNFVQ